MRNPLIYLFTIYSILILHFDLKSQGGLSIGIQGGMGFSQYFFQNFVEQDFVPIYQGGIVISQLNPKNLGVQVEILRTQKAWQENIGGTYKKKVVINYIEIPFSTVFKFGKNKSSLIVNAGLHFSFALNADTSNVGQQPAANTSMISYNPLIYSNWDYGLNGGIGYQYSFGRSALLLQLTYSQGLKNIFERDYTAIYRSLNQNLSVNLIYKVSLAKKVKNQKKKVTTNPIE